MISRILQYGAFSHFFDIHILYAINAGIDRSIVVILSFKYLCRPRRSQRRSSIFVVISSKYGEWCSVVFVSDFGPSIKKKIK